MERRKCMVFAASRLNCIVLEADSVSLRAAVVEVFGVGWMIAVSVGMPWTPDERSVTAKTAGGSAHRILCLFPSNITGSSGHDV